MRPVMRPIRNLRLTVPSGLILLSLLPSLLVGCLIFSSDDGGDRGSLVIRASLVTQATESSAFEGKDVGVCPSATEMLNDLENLSAYAVIQRSHSGLPGEIVIAGEGGLVVAPADGESQLLLSGDLEFDFGPAGSDYDLSVELFYQGRELAGSYAGTLSLESGIEVTIESFDIGRLLPVPGEPGVFQASTVVLCVSSEAVDDDGIPGPDVFCTDEEDIEDRGLFYDRNQNTLSFEYLRKDVEWDATGELRDIVTRMTGRLGSTVIYRGKGRIVGIFPGLPDPVEVAVEMVQVPESGPGSLGEPLSGTIFVAFTDGEPPSETGNFVLLRSESVCSD